MKFTLVRLHSHTPKVKCCLLLNMSWMQYIGKTDHNHVTSLNEQGSRDDQPMYQHLSKCEHYNYTINLVNSPDTDSTTVAVDEKEYILNAVLPNFRAVGSCINWS